MLSLRAHGWTRNLPKFNHVTGEKSDDPFEESFRFVLPGYNLRPPQVNNDGRTTMWTLKYEAVKYDFFLIQRNGDNFRWYSHQRKPPLELVNEVPAHGLATFVLYDRQWQVPDPAEDFLTRIYGDWRRPDPGYLYWRDSRAIVERYPWTGERRPPD